MILDERAPHTTPLEDVEREIRNKLYEARRGEARRALIDRLEEDARIERFPDALEGVNEPQARQVGALENIPMVPTRDLDDERAKPLSGDDAPKN